MGMEIVPDQWLAERKGVKREGVVAEHLPPGPHPPAEPWVGRRLKLRMTSHHSGSAKATRGDVTGSETEVKNFRMIWDGRYVNSHCTVKSFTMQTLSRSRNLIRKRDKMFSLDLKSVSVFRRGPPLH